MRWGFLLLLALQSSAFGHSAPSGWTYPIDCCSNQDCREVLPEEIGETSGGFYVKETGETIPSRDKRVRQSPDGLYHLCVSETSKKIYCIFVPGGS